MKGQRIGYIRVGSFDQNPERQLEHVPLDKVFTDKASGKDTQRPELDALLSFVRDGGTVVALAIEGMATVTDEIIDQTAMILPHVKITALLLEVDDWTGFTRHFAHLKSGDLAKDKNLLLTTSIKQGRVTASLMLRKLGSYPRQNGLAVALRGQVQTATTAATGLACFIFRFLRRPHIGPLTKGYLSIRINRRYQLC